MRNVGASQNYCTLWPTCDCICVPCTEAKKKVSPKKTEHCQTHESGCHADCEN